MAEGMEAESPTSEEPWLLMESDLPCICPMARSDENIYNNSALAL
jgi:hypothetical protein